MLSPFQFSNNYAVVFLFLLSACQFQETEKQEVVAAVPKELCEKTRADLESIKKVVAYENDDAGGVTIEESVWRGMGGMQDMLVGSLAYKNACDSAPASGSITVTVRNEWGRVMTERQVPVIRSMELED